MLVYVTIGRRQDGSLVLLGANETQTGAEHIGIMAGADGTCESGQTLVLGPVGLNTYRAGGMPAGAPWRITIEDFDRGGSKLPAPIDGSGGLGCE